MSQEIREQSKN